MADTIVITASLRIEASPDYVRAQYRDIDHHIRNNVHPSIAFAWQPCGPGERKVKTEFRILGVPQFDVAMLEDAPDGVFVIRYVEGTNAGMVVTHEFVPLDGGKATDVRLRASAPSTLARKILGPLFALGAGQVLKKALHEDKADIEKKTFAPGRAAGNVARAVQPLEHVTDPEAARAVVAAACLVTTADGILDDAERSVVGAIAKKLDVDQTWRGARAGRCGGRRVARGGGGGAREPRDVVGRAGDAARDRRGGGRGRCGAGDDRRGRGQRADECVTVQPPSCALSTFNRSHASPAPALHASA